jgi:hypothetical protein
MPETEDETATKAPATVTIPAWIGSGGVGLLLLMQALGLDAGQLTGKGEFKRIDDLDGRVGRLWEDASRTRTKMSSLESDARILFERVDTATNDRAEMKVTLREMADTMSEIAQTMVRIETKMDARE